ncbi:MAG: flagellar export protein FliJ [Dethiobacter sp.]|nr:flagellar export protein FliJ [Dethiobacter sp.]
MSGFRFRLQRVLNYREDMEKEAQSILAGARISLQESLTELAGMKYELTEVYNVQKTGSESLDVNGRLFCARYIDHLSKRISVTEQAVQEKEDKVSEKRSDLETRMLERKMLSSLKERQSTAFNMEIKLSEQKMNDEFALNGYSRRQG